jgi:translocation and assembly module TamB
LVSADVELLLGKQVHFEGFNLSTDVTGSLRIIHEPKQLTRGIGILRSKKGEYTAYGKTLTVALGQLIYNGNAIDDPAFEIRAERTIDVLSQSQPQETMPSGMQVDKNALPQIAPDKGFPELNNVQTGTVGVVGSGTLKKPKFKLFSNPTMPETDILSYLLIGVPTSQASTAQGQILFQALNQMSSSLGPGDSSRFMNLLKTKFGLDDVHLQTSTYIDKTSNKSESQTAVVLGKALSPRLFINYTIGLLDPVNILQITYKITRNWSVQTDANNRGSSGGDVVYSIERN